MEYCILKNITASCSICKKSHQLFTTIQPLKKHIIDQHIGIVGNDVTIGDNNWLWKFFYISEYGVPICSICKCVCVPLPELTSIINHLMFDHYINKRKAKRLHNWVKLYVTELSTQERKCLLCNDIFNESNSYNLMLHLTFIHLLDVPLGIQISEE